MSLTIGVDVGGTKVAAGVVDLEGHIIREIRRPTRGLTAGDVADEIATMVAELRTPEVAAVGVGAAGYVSADRATMLFAPNLSWRSEPLRAHLEQRVGLPVVVENDANAAAWAESRFGAGRGVRNLVAVTVGTGIGGGVIAEGRLLRGGFGVAGEVGHLQMVPGGRACGCGKEGCWEQYASGQALVREAADRGGSWADGPAITRAAQAGDALAVECFQAVGDWLGRGLADIASVLDPAVFVIGGGVSEAGDLLLGPARASFATALPVAAYRPLADVRPALLGNAAGIVGAADLART